MLALKIAHIITGSLGLLSGAFALYSAKGTSLHRKSGDAFVVAMLGMSFTGALLAFLRGDHASLTAGCLTFYLVSTAFLAVRRPQVGFRKSDVIAMFGAVAVAALGLRYGVEALNSATKTKDGFPPTPYFVFGAVALIGAVLDLRMICAAQLNGKHRLARHLWRMCFALFIATLSFFIGQAKLFPPQYRIMPLLALPVLTVFLTTVYWIARTLWIRPRNKGPVSAAVRA